MKVAILHGLGVLSLLLAFSCNSLSDKSGMVDYELFLTADEERPIFVALGGSEGGMVYAGKETKNLRDSILSRGYHFLAIGYFGTPNTPKELERISLDAIYDTISSISQQPFIDQNQIAVFGGSRGGELALNIASRYPDIAAVLAIVPSYVTLPARFGWNEASSWTFKGEEVPWVAALDEARALMDDGDFYGGFSKVIENHQSKTVMEAAIEVEKINAPILFVSSSEDEVWPSTLMVNRMIERLEKNNFKHPYQHVELEGSHAAFTKNYGVILGFLNKHLPVDK
ncbi:MAG: acyl-CoA thioester hydrolase/BAAT C-terminal domain-containing protein [Cyclobacteriaceae bacterium]|mgnify:CR=1 FL=1